MCATIAYSKDKRAVAAVETPAGAELSGAAVGRTDFSQYPERTTSVYRSRNTAINSAVLVVSFDIVG